MFLQETADDIRPLCQSPLCRLWRMTDFVGGSGTTENYIPDTQMSALTFIHILLTRYALPAEQIPLIIDFLFVIQDFFYFKIFFLFFPVVLPPVCYCLTNENVIPILGKAYVKCMKTNK